MSSISSSPDGGKSSNNHQHLETRDSHNGQLPDRRESSKNAPLSPDDGEQPKFPRRVWEWSKKNRTVIALVCLLIGGLIAIAGSFGGLSLHVLSYARD